MHSEPISLKKTITEDRTTRSVEHIMSLEPNELKSFVENIRDVERAMGQPRRIMTEVEKQKRFTMRRSLILNEDVKIGQKLSTAKVKFKRPGFGIAPDVYETMLNMSFTQNLPKGHVVCNHDLS